VTTPPEDPVRITVSQIVVTGTVSGETPVQFSDQPDVLTISRVDVTYVPGPDGQWVAAPDVRIDVELLDGPSVGPVFRTTRADPYPPWLVDFIDTARPPATP
jgi:hypothetical protein